MSFLEIDLRERRDGYTMSELQSHSYYELYFLLEGERSVFYENKMFRVTANAFCVIPPFHMHKTSGGPCRRININVSPDCLDAAEQRFLTQCAEEVAFTLPPQNADFLKKILLSAACADRTEHRRRQTLSPAFVHTLLYLLEKEPLIPIESRAALSETERDTRILETVSYINEHYREPLTLQKLSEQHYTSVNTLCARFRSAMNCSVMQYLTFVRIRHAKELLETTAKSMEEIAELCGFSGANYFGLVFKKNVGLSPANYRKSR